MATISRALLVKGIDGYSSVGSERKAAFHRAGQRFLKQVAEEIGLTAGQFDLRSNKGGMAVSGEVTLHSDDIYIQMFESCMMPGVQILFRTCYKRTDYTGGTNCYTDMSALKNGENYVSWTVRLKGMIEKNRAEHGVNRI